MENNTSLPLASHSIFHISGVRLLINFSPSEVIWALCARVEEKGKKKGVYKFGMGNPLKEVMMNHFCKAEKKYQ